MGTQLDCGRSRGEPDCYSASSVTQVDPLVPTGSEVIQYANMKTADFLSLLFVGDDQDSEKSKPAGSDGERRGVKRQRDEKDEHGRAYYEFREEAYHSR